MRLSLRFTLIATFLTLTSILVVGESLISGRWIRQDLTEILEAELAGDLEAVSALLNGMGPLDPDSAVRTASRAIGRPVTLLDRDGLVVGASAEPGFQGGGLAVAGDSSVLAVFPPGDVVFSQRRDPGEEPSTLFATTRMGQGETSHFIQVAASLHEIDRIARSRSRASLGLLIPASALAVILALVLARVLARPFRALERRAGGLASGDFARGTPGPIRIKELDDLDNTFNGLSEGLRNRHRTLEWERDEMQALIDCMGEAVVVLAEDHLVLLTNQAAIDLLDLPNPVPRAPIGSLVREPSMGVLLEEAVDGPFTAREITLGERNLLVSARLVEGGGAVVTLLDVTEIRRLEMVRRDFVANASHELKTPLTAMRGFAETLLEDDPPEELRRGFLESIRVNTLRLQNLVDDLLDLSRLESGGWVAMRTEVDIRPLVEDVLNRFRDEAAEKGLELSVAGGAMVMADEQGLEQVVQNLIHNALRYSPKGGAIDVVIETRGERARMEVRDTGIGIPASALPRIFERFFRVDHSRSRTEGGTGLGLAIVRHLVEAMGGEVGATSEPGQGTCIFLSLPLAGAGEE